MEALGPVPVRTPVGHRARGLQRRRQCLELLQPRPVALARLSLGRGRPGRHLRRQAAPVFRPRSVERPRRDPEGTCLRVDQLGRQPRRGRQGVLLLPRLDSDALVHALPVQVPAAGFPYEQLVAENGSRDRNAFEYELLDTGVFDDDRYFDVFVEYAKAGPDDVLVRITAANRGPEAAPLHLLPTLWFRNTWALGRRCSTAHPGRLRRRDRCLARRAGRLRARSRRTARAAVHRERDEHAATVEPAQCDAVRQGRLSPLRGQRRNRRSQP